MSDDTPSPLNNVITIDDEGRFPRVDDSAALSSCVELCQAPPTKPTTQSLRRVRPQSFRLQGSRWPGRSDPASAWMFRTDARRAKNAPDIADRLGDTFPLADIRGWFAAFAARVWGKIETSDV